MQGIKHFSFDLWLTLIKSNSVFKKERCKYFFLNFNTLNKSFEEVEIIFRNVDLKCNQINEITGQNIESEEMYLMVIYYLNNSLEEFKTLDLNILYSEMERLFFNYPPVVFSSDVYIVLDLIKKNDINTLSILSNTGFIKGKTLEVILDNLKLLNYFDFRVYSDEIGYSKPNSKMFDYLINKVISIRRDTILNSEIIHIGDNYYADILGAQKLGIKSLQINSNKNSILDLLNAK